MLRPKVCDGANVVCRPAVSSHMFHSLTRFGPTDRDGPTMLNFISTSVVEFMFDLNALGLLLNVRRERSSDSSDGNCFQILSFFWCDSDSYSVMCIWPPWSTARLQPSMSVPSFRSSQSSDELYRDVLDPA